MNHIFFINNNCVFCNKCLVLCPTHAIKQNINRDYFVLDYACIGCFKCFYICPVNSIEFYKIKSSIKINKYILKDRLYVKKILYNKAFCNYSNF